MSNKRVRGEQLYVFFGDNYTPLICSTDCSLFLSTELVERASNNGWRRWRSGRKEWRIECSGFYVNSDVLPTNLPQSIDLLGKNVEIAMSVLPSELSKVGGDVAKLSPVSDHTIRGVALVKDCQYVGTRGGIATYFISLQGDGGLFLMSAGLPYPLPITLG